MSIYKDDTGKTSMMRHITITLVWVGVIWGTIEILYNMLVADIEIHTTLIISVIGIAVTGKVGQKMFERPIEENELNE